MKGLFVDFLVQSLIPACVICVHCQAPGSGIQQAVISNAFLADGPKLDERSSCRQWCADCIECALLSVENCDVSMMSSCLKKSREHQQISKQVWRSLRDEMRRVFVSAKFEARSAVARLPPILNSAY